MVLYIDAPLQLQHCLEHCHFPNVYSLTIRGWKSYSTIVMQVHLSSPNGLLQPHREEGYHWSALNVHIWNIALQFFRNCNHNRDLLKHYPSAKYMSPVYSRALCCVRGLSRDTKWKSKSSCQKTRKRSRQRRKKEVELCMYENLDYLVWFGNLNFASVKLWHCFVLHHRLLRWSWLHAIGCQRFWCELLGSLFLWVHLSFHKQIICMRFFTFQRCLMQCTIQLFQTYMTGYDKLYSILFSTIYNSGNLDSQ